MTTDTETFFAELIARDDPNYLDMVRGIADNFPQFRQDDRQANGLFPRECE
jgi:hypothetical protein